VREAVAAGTAAIGKVHTDYNLANIFTKQLSPEKDTTSCIVLPTKLNGGANMSWPGPRLRRLPSQVPFSWFAWAFQVKEVSRIRFSTEFSRIWVGYCMSY